MDRVGEQPYEYPGNTLPIRSSIEQLKRTAAGPAKTVL